MALVKNSTVLQKQFYRQTFDLQVAGVGSVLLYTLLLNPDDFSMDEPARNSVTQTLGGAYVTDFGAGLPTVTLTGTTGYKKRVSAEGFEFDGFDGFIAFRQQVYRNFIETNNPDMSLNWYNWEDDEYYEIQPSRFRLQRNKTEPLLYRYELTFTCIRKLKSANQKQVTDFLQTTPSARDAELNLDTAISSVSEFINTVFT